MPVKQASPCAAQVLGGTAQTESIQVKLVSGLCGRLEPEPRPLHGQLHTGVGQLVPVGWGALKDGA